MQEILEQLEAKRERERQRRGPRRTDAQHAKGKPTARQSFEDPGGAGTWLCTTTSASDD